MDSTQLATFQAVIEEGSFDAAARALHVTPSAVSQRIKALEQDVGQVLVRRAKPCEPTTAGQALVRLAGQITLLEREALAEARGGFAAGDRVRVPVVINADSLHTWFLPALTRLPGVVFDLHQDDQDHTAELLRAGTVMAAVTSQHVAVQGCRVTRLGAMRYLAVAAPALGPVDFATTPVILLNRKDELQHRFLAALSEEHSAPSDERSAPNQERSAPSQERSAPSQERWDPPVHYVPAAAAFVEAIRLGLGWALVPEQIARDDITAGRLRELTPGRHLDVPLHWQCWRMESRVLADLTAAVTETAATALRR